MRGVVLKSTKLLLTKLLLIIYTVGIMSGCGGAGSFSPEAGDYADQQRVTITHTSADTIYYTIDGSLPSTESLVYTQPIDISESATLYALPYVGGNPGAVFSASYNIKRPTRLLVEAEAYQRFQDTTAGNMGGAYRQDDVDIEHTSDVGAGFNVGWTAAGEWLEYDLIFHAGTYTLASRIASNLAGGSYSILIDGVAVGTREINDVRGWQSFYTDTVGQVTLTEGHHTVRFYINGGELNLNWIDFSPVDNTPPPVLGQITPLYDASTVQESAVSYDRGDALVTRFSDRARDRHAKEDQFQAYDHYLSHYWTHRTARFEFIDYVAKGGNSIDITFITEWPITYPFEFRAWYSGYGSVAQYHGNYGAEGIVQEGPGTWDNDFRKVSNDGEQYKYTLTVDDYRALNWTASDGRVPLERGQRMEIEVSQFLNDVPEGRNNYYGTTFLYIVGEGFVPWKTAGSWEDQSSEREDSYPIAERAWLGGKTTLPYNYTDEPDNHFMQMATNLSNANGQPFVLGRRVHHTHFDTGQHDESPDNGFFNELSGKVGTHYINTSCASCHIRNGRASIVDINMPLDKWVVKIGDGGGGSDPYRGGVLQPRNVNVSSEQGEGDVVIASWSESDGLRSPNYIFSSGEPARFSARLAPQLVGLGLLDAVDESTILEREDATDRNGDGISGKAQLSLDPVTGNTRLGRFGYKAATSSLKHQIAAALNSDMGVMTSVLPMPDCGVTQSTCGNEHGVELSDEHLNHLVKYVALLGVRAQRNIDDPLVVKGQQVFESTGCESCHRSAMQTSAFAPLAELRNQLIHPYTDMLLHDLGEGLADNLGEGEATGAEWRTAPLWGVGLSACVTAGVSNFTGQQGDEVCIPDASYLHDGRARTIDEAIRWHGGEAANITLAYEQLSAGNKQALLAFVDSL
ncbi:hypothetical protein A9Q99_13090 [Gammaproteobacteria bacterium 45_16_T64]|nr:hypothetical protein A9Q99_13090 [Gammaproteobacteria bacterium 45_16_T64]